MSEYAIKPLDATTWDAFAELVERNNGVFGGCWCIGYHPECAERGINYRAAKEDRVRTDRAHAALSSTRTAPRRAGASTAAPRSFRASSTSASTTRTRRHSRTGGSPASSSTRGIAARASPGRPGGRARPDRPAGGGLVEAIPEVTAGREAQGRFLFSATVELFEQYGFTRVRQVGKHAWIVSRAVEPV